jgi:hypothetical protein
MSKSISLYHIKYVKGGSHKWPNWDRWAGRKVRIWSDEWRAWWRPNGNGYTDDEAQAWVLPFPEAYDRTHHCGPEKKINYFAVSSGVRESK